jgi:hypothetical protein
LRYRSVNHYAETTGTGARGPATGLPVLREDRDTTGPGLPMGWTIQSGIRGWTYLCGTCTRSNLRSIESRLFERDALGLGTAN